MILLVILGPMKNRSLDIDAKWTHSTPIQGWKHFRICGRRNDNNTLMVEMMAVCDRKVRFWMSGSEVKSKDSWQTGWVGLF